MMTYELINRDKTTAAINSYLSHGLSLEDLRHTATAIGRLGLEEYGPFLGEQLLHHTDAIVRYNATSSLGLKLHNTDYSDKYLNMAESDPDSDCRSMACAVLGNLYQSSSDVRVLSKLAKIAIEDAEEYVRVSAYKAALIVQGLSKARHLEILRSLRLKVDVNKMRELLNFSK
jgi:hypothetical protein